VTQGFGAAIPNGPKKNYRGYKFIRVWITNDDQVQTLLSLEMESLVRLWDYPNTKGHTDMIVSPDAMDELLSRMVKLDVKSEILVNDMQFLIDHEAFANEIAKNESSSRSANGKATPNEYYARYTDIVQWLRQLVALNPTIASTFIVGKTYYGQDIYGIKIGLAGINKPKITIEGCIHSREWLACATTNYVINQLLVDSRTNPAIQALLRTYDWHIIPVQNVDGYDYTFTNDRYHRKTLSPNPGFSCVGADPNRNFDNHFAEAGASTYPCSDTYAGRSPFSESETKAVGDMMRNLRPKVHFSVHAFSQLWLLPWGWTYTLPPNYNEMLRVANLGNAALQAQNGLRFRVGNIANTIYLASGSSVDYAYDNVGILYSSAFEMRPGQGAADGFNPAPSNINPSGREIYAGIIAYVQNVV
jgi:hypothetical protein